VVRLAQALLACALFLLLLSAQTSKPISKNGLLKALQIGGLTQSEFIEQVNARGVSFTMNKDIEAELRAAGASSELIDAIRAKTKGANSRTPVPGPDHAPPNAAAAPGVAASAPGGATWAPGVYVKQDGKWAELLEESVNWKKGSSLRRLTLGLGKGEFVGSIPGAASPNGYRVPITFRIAAAEGFTAENYALVLLHSKEGLREVRVDGSGANARLVRFGANPVDLRLWEIQFSQGPGEYGFLPPVREGDLPIAPKMYTFRVIP
jgi:hypothetical protein